MNKSSNENHEFTLISQEGTRRGRFVIAAICPGLDSSTGVGGSHSRAMIPLTLEATSLRRIVDVQIDGYKRCKAGTQHRKRPELHLKGPIPARAGEPNQRVGR